MATESSTATAEGATATAPRLKLKYREEIVSALR